MSGFRALAIATVLVAAVGSSSAQSGYDLYQQALVKERGDGKLQEAVELYLTVVKSAGRDRALAARALLQVASCYEKLGNQEEARNTYMRVRTEFADQTQRRRPPHELAWRNSRHARLCRSVAAWRHRRTTPHRSALDLPRGGGPSPDGRYFAFWMRLTISPFAIWRLAKAPKLTAAIQNGEPSRAGNGQRTAGGCSISGAESFARGPEHQPNCA